MNEPRFALPSHSSAEPVRPLTEGQEKVLDLLMQGWTYGAIADELKLSVRTVHDRIEQIAQLLPYEREENVHPREHVMLWGVHRVWHRYVAGLEAHHERTARR